MAFTGGSAGPWSVLSIAAVRGATLPPAARLQVTEDTVAAPGEWTLRGVVSHTRYTTAAEAAELRRRSPELGRASATRAALIPIRKNADWWALAQDERRELLEECSRHITLGLDRLPAVARRLHHGRDLGEPFDFLTWFEYAPDAEAGFEELVAALRATPEWDYVDREVDVRLERA